MTDLKERASLTKLPEIKQKKAKKIRIAQEVQRLGVKKKNKGSDSRIKSDF